MASGWREIKAVTGKYFSKGKKRFIKHRERPSSFDFPN